MCWYAHPPQRPKYGHSGVTRWGELSLTCTSSASANCFFSRKISAETPSPSIVYGTKMAFPCSRPTPFPPKAMSSIFRSTTRIGSPRERCALPREGTLNGGFQVFELDRFDQMFGKTCAQTPFDIAVVPKTADRDPRNL